MTRQDQFIIKEAINIKNRFYSRLTTDRKFKKHVRITLGKTPQALQSKINYKSLTLEEIYKCI